MVVEAGKRPGLGLYKELRGASVVTHGVVMEGGIGAGGVEMLPDWHPQLNPFCEHMMPGVDAGEIETGSQFAPGVEMLETDAEAMAPGVELLAGKPFVRR